MDQFIGLTHGSTGERILLNIDCISFFMEDSATKSCNIKIKESKGLMKVKESFTDIIKLFDNICE